MGFLGLGRSALKDADPRKREAAVRELPVAEQGKLMDAALGDSDPGVRRAAAAKVVETDLLRELVRHPDAPIAQMAREKLANVAVEEVKRRPMARAGELLEQITEQSALVTVALQAEDRAVREAAFARILGLDAPSEQLLATLAIQEESGAYGERAVPRIAKRQVLKDVSKKAKAAAVRSAAEARMAELAAQSEKPSREQQRKQRNAELAELVEQARVLAVASDVAAAHDKLTTIERDAKALEQRFAEAPADEELAAVHESLGRFREQLKQRRAEATAAAEAMAAAAARRRELLAAWEQRAVEAEAATPQEREALAAELAEAWAAAGEPGPEAVSELEQAYAVLVARVIGQAIAPEAAAEQPVQDMRPELGPEALAAIEALIAEAEALSQREDWRDADQAFKTLDKRWREAAIDLGADDERRTRFRSAYGVFKDRRREAREQRGREREQRLETMAGLVRESAELAAAQPEGEAVEAHRKQIKELQRRWREIGPVPADRARPLREEFRANCDTAFEPVRRHFEAKDWERFARVPKAEELIAAAAALNEESPEDGNELIKAVKDLQARWKRLGQLPRDKKDELWEAFKGHCDAIYERLQPWFAERDRQREENLARKQALIEELELQLEQAPAHAVGAGLDAGLDASRIDKVKDIQARWKEVGPVPREQDKQTWGRYKALLDRFYAARRQQRAVEQKEREGNLAHKQEICDAIAALADDLEAYKGGQRFGNKTERDFFEDFRSLQGQYRSAGFVPRKDMDASKQRYKEVCDRVHAALEDWFAARDAERQGNLERKQALLVRLEELLEEEHPEWFRDEVRKLQDEWRDAGPVPRDAMDINQRFRQTVEQILHADRAPAQQTQGGEPSVKFGDEAEVVADGLAAPEPERRPEADAGSSAEPTPEADAAPSAADAADAAPAPAAEVGASEAGSDGAAEAPPDPEQDAVADEPPAGDDR